MSYDSCPYSRRDTSVIRTMEGRSVTSRYHGRQISRSQQSCLTEMTQRCPFALPNDERKVTCFRFVPDWNHLACVAGAWKKWAKERTGAREGDTRGVSPLLARQFFSCAHYFQAPATQARNHHARELSYVSIFFVFLLPYLHLLHDHFLLRSRNFATITTRQSPLMARLASYPTYPCVGAGPSELGSEFSKRSRHLGKGKRSSRTLHTSHFLVDPSHGPFSFLEMLRSPITIAPRCLLKFGQRAKFAWNKKKQQQMNEQWETGTDQRFIRRGNSAIMWLMNILRTNHIPWN